MSDLNRREFVVLTVTGACIAGCASQSDLPTTQPGTVNIGTSSDYLVPGVYAQFLKSQKMLVVQNKDRLYACTAVCTHKGCTLTFKEELFRCPCHGSAFGIDGIPVHGPATQPLVRYAITIDEWGRILVDKSREFPQVQWEKVECYLKLKK